MKLIATLSVCLFVVSASFGQTASATKKGSAHKAGNPDKTMIFGTLKDARNKPVKGVKAFVYKQDSTIVASGFTDAMGKFETNNVAPGTYFIKFVYPTDKTVLVYGIEMKKSTEINYKGNPPAEDTMLSLETIMPKADPKKAPAKK